MQTIVRLDRRAVSPVVAEILLVAIAVVLAAVIYIMAAGLLTSPGTNRPLVTFAPVTYPDAKGNATLSVAGASMSLGPTSYKVNLVVEGANGTSAFLAASGTPLPIRVVGATYYVTYNDLSTDGHVNSGDTFVIGGSGVPLPKNLHYTFYLIWATDGTVVQQVPWFT